MDTLLKTCERQGSEWQIFDTSPELCGVKNGNEGLQFFLNMPEIFVKGRSKFKASNLKLKLHIQDMKGSMCALEETVISCQHIHEISEKQSQSLMVGIG